MVDLMVRTEDLGGVVVARVAGALDVATEVEFLCRVRELGLDEASCVVVDLTATTFLDADGMAALVQLARQINDHLGCLAVVTRARGRRQLRVSRLDRLIPVFDTVDEGLTWIQSHGSTRQPRIPASSFDSYLLTLRTPPLRGAQLIPAPPSRRAGTPATDGAAARSTRRPMATAACLTRMPE